MGIKTKQWMECHRDLVPRDMSDPKDRQAFLEQQEKVRDATLHIVRKAQCSLLSFVLPLEPVRTA